MNIKRKGTGESNAQIIISLINNKLQQANTLRSLLPRTLALRRFRRLSFHFAVRPRAISLSDEYSSAALIYNPARAAAAAPPCLFWRCEGEPQEDVFANTLLTMQPKIQSFLVVSQMGPTYFSLPSATCFRRF